MEQNIEYMGMTSQPSDYACGDGEMKLAVNAEYRDGGYHAVRVPKVVEFRKEGFEPLFVHTTADSKELYICAKKTDDKWLLVAISSNEDSISFTNSLTIDSMEDIGSFASIGNLLSCVVRGKLYYFRYNNAVYEQIQIDSKLNPVFKFAANRTRFIPKELNNYDQIYTITDSIEGQFNIKFSLTDEKLDEGLNVDADNAYIGLVNKRVNYLKKNNALVFPVLLRYAVKMYDGNYCYISPPILLYPYSDVLSATFKDSEYRSADYSGNGGYPSVSVTNPTIEMTSYSIAVKIENSELEKLKEFEKLKGLISGIDFFVSKELYTYDLTHVYAYRDNSDGSNHVYFKKKNDWKKEIDNIGEFYLIKSYSIRELLEKKDGLYWNLLEDKDILNDVVYDSLESYTERSRLDDSKTTGENLMCGNVYSYNKRLLTIGMESYDMDPFVMSMFVTPIVYFYYIGQQRYDLPIPMKMEMDQLYAKCGSIKDIKIIKNNNGEQVVLKVLSGDIEYLPIYYYYPQAGCSSLVVQDDYIYNYDMKTCDFIKGSQCILEEYKKDYEEMPSLTKRVNNGGNVVKISEVNNPFVFKYGNSVTCGNGQILSLAIFAREVSQGQFGEYPILAFCTDGVYSIGVAADGSLKNSSPYSYDVISNKGSIANIDRSIVFAGDQGLIIFGDNGRQLLLSADKTATYAYDQGRSDHQKTFVENFLKGDVMRYDDPPKFADLYTYLTTGAKMAYDYPHGRLIVYNPSYDYSYVMEVKSGMWSIMNKSFSRSLNVYEKCLLVDKDRETVYDYSSDDVIEAQKAYLITRPFKLGDYNVHKSVQSIIQRGVFCDKEDVKQCLYGSNDLYNWVPVKSSNSIYMRGMRGTGYKYYRSILFIPEFKQNEVLHGASVTYEQRLTNKMR